MSRSSHWFAAARVARDGAFGAHVLRILLALVILSPEAALGHAILAHIAATSSARRRRRRRLAGLLRRLLDRPHLSSGRGDGRGSSAIGAVLRLRVEGLTCWPECNALVELLDDLRMASAVRGPGNIRELRLLVERRRAVAAPRRICSLLIGVEARVHLANLRMRAIDPAPFIEDRVAATCWRVSR